jgi:hypothetical protein
VRPAALMPEPPPKPPPKLPPPKPLPVLPPLAEILKSHCPSTCTIEKQKESPFENEHLAVEEAAMAGAGYDATPKPEGLAAAPPKTPYLLLLHLPGIGIPVSVLSLVRSR